MIQPTILYVEDEARSRRVMQLMLNRMNIPQVTMFEDSSDFLARAEALDPRPDVILLDIHVRPYNGFEMLAMLRQSELLAQVRIVALTASVMNEEVDQLKTAGFDGCLAKPIDSDAFPEILAQIMRGESIWHIIA
jgi:CheY-like chemotaxis protein